MQSRFHRMIDQRLNVREVGDIIEQGVTFPARCHLSEGINGIVKYPKNPAESMIYQI